jgi:hypothetical protein
VNYPGKASWSDAIEVFPPEERDASETEGHRVRLTLRLFTSGNQYLIAVTESLDPNNRGIYSLTCCVNWQIPEKRRQQAIDETYLGGFQDGLRSKHILWAQTIRWGDAHDALSGCAAVILANELLPEPRKNLTTERVSIPTNVATKFPAPADD